MPDWRVPVTMMSVGPSVAAAGAAGWSEAIAADGKERASAVEQKRKRFIYISPHDYKIWLLLF
jgi:hypothetical protein